MAKPYIYVIAIILLMVYEPRQLFGNSAPILIGDLTERLDVAAENLSYISGEEKTYDERSIFNARATPLPSTKLEGTSYYQWVRFSLLNNSDTPKKLMIRLSAIIRSVKFAVKSNDDYGAVLKESGLSVPLGLRDYPHRDYIFQFEVKPRNEAQIAFGVSSDFPIGMQPTIYAKDYFFHEDHSIQAMIGIYFGIILALSFVYLVVWIWVKETIYVTYLSVLIFSHLLGVGSIYGLTNELIFASNPFLSERTVLIALGLMLVSSLWFTKTFLGISDNYPRLNWTLRFQTLLVAAMTIAATFTSHRYLAIAFDVMAALGMLTSSTAGTFLGLFRRTMAGRFFCMSWFFYMAGSAVFMAQDYGALNGNVFTRHSLMVGTALESLVFTVALGARLFNTRKLLDRFRGTLSRAVMSQKDSDSFERSEIDYEPRNIELTIIFIDTVDFSTTMNRFGSKELFLDLRAHFAHLKGMIQTFGGIVVGTGGDSVLAVFGYDPISRQAVLGHQLKAIDCAVEIQNMAVTQIAKGVDRARPLFPVRIGIESGNVIVGDLGDDKKADITIVGDTVNFASRLEKACSPFRVLVGANAQGHFKNASKYRLQSKFIKIKHHLELIEAFEISSTGSQEEGAIRKALTTLNEYLKRNQNLPRFETKGLNLLAHSSYENFRILNFSENGLLLEGDRHYFANGVEFEITEITRDGTTIFPAHSNIVFPFLVEVRWGAVENHRINLGVRIDARYRNKEILFETLSEQLDVTSSILSEGLTAA